MGSALDVVAPDVDTKLDPVSEIYFAWQTFVSKPALAYTGISQCDASPPLAMVTLHRFEST